MIYRLLVEDKPGVLDRIAGLVRRSGRNISFLLVFETEPPGKSLLVFKLEGGTGDDAVTRRVSEIDCVYSLETQKDTITGRIIDITR